MRVSYWRSPDGSSDKTNISEYHAKQLLKKFGGAAWTCCIDERGECYRIDILSL